MAAVHDNLLREEAAMQQVSLRLLSAAEWLERFGPKRPTGKRTRAQRAAVTDPT